MAGRVQLAIPGAYIHLGSHVHAPQLRNQLNKDKYIIDFPVSLLDRQAFEEDSHTTKVGGVPNWLSPSEITEGYTPPLIPSCKSCHKSLVLVTQVFAPFDFPSDSSECPAPFFEAAHLGKRTTHARTVYVFACNNPRCGNAPGTWCALSLCQSSGIIVNAPVSTASPVYVDHTDEHDDDVSSDEEDDALVNAMMGLNVTNRTSSHTPSKQSLSTSLKHNSDSSTEPTPSSSAFAGLTRNKGTAVKSGLFDMGGWSDDEEEEEEVGHEALRVDGSCAGGGSDSDGEVEGVVPEDLPLPSLKPTNTQNSALVAAVADLSKLLDERDQLDREREVKVQAHKEALVAKQVELQLQQQQEKERALEEYAKTHEKIVVSDNCTAMSVLRPFYLIWMAEPNTKSVDLSKEERMLQEYYAREEESKQGKEKEPQGEGKKREGEDDGDEDEYESSGDKVFRRFNNRVQRQPDQCLRYWPKVPLRLHTLPTTEETAKLIAMAASHPLDQHKNISGLWGIHPVPDCSICGAPLRLEFQLMPNLLNELHLDDEEDDALPQALSTLDKGMDWGVVDVYMCPMLCAPDEYVNNFCIVQPSL